ncbi:TPA: dihydrolipoyl dehydrogenase [Salmonella enterica subsp. enterica serovar Bredeney]|uniref:Dihydrolipoyl dehydrogenase n=4 Tax=Salmonella enterica TaxID=28901 RepID=A0A5I3ELI2_SALET|nr:dihydrolipoyl dehydrogenase [Salmonella enterica]EAA2100031.1 dihydrolipoyl dehydrogenase [Salmonella enterica subsp. enterica serovar Bredeney]EAA7353890.1 dihydrolipoyl dehydrogenase [Salmonella enterica subsp. enterica]EAB7892598.1 dihydrolipoyl dehydrogenase [Salmonella enterica subsp. enterica serovar Newport]EBW5413427.1 dihydrolipoyl dehydrogenase [Salmonella enterica subsp. enterica serovar Bonn]EBY7414752.1 dihydrolipoyl dehydrogenase [Salmonella enterica subsp. enterica serovar Al
MDTEFDVLIVGGGPGGYVAAIRAAQLGFRTALVERKSLGGVCLNWGCIPTKTLLHGADTARALAEASLSGFLISDYRFDYSVLQKRSRGVAGTLAKGIDGLLKKHKVTVIMGEATLLQKGLVKVTTEDGSQHKIQAASIILATGARPRKIPGIMPDGISVWTSSDALASEKLPSSVLVIGSGAIGAEFSSLYSDLGCRVSVVETAPRIFPQEDEDISVFMSGKFKEKGIDIYTSSRLASYEVRSDGLIVCHLETPDGKKVTEVTTILIAAGVQPNVENLGLEELGVKLKNGFINVNESYQTNIPGIYAIGDVSGGPCLAHKASAEGILCVEKLAGVSGERSLSPDFIPRCTYTSPQVASFGLTEEKAKELKKLYKTGTFPYLANGKALASNAGDGFVKVIFDADSGELLGAHMVGHDVTEQIYGLCTAWSLEATEESLHSVIFPHPTLSEAIAEAVLAADGISIHQ